MLEGKSEERALDRRVVWIWRLRALGATCSLAVPAAVLAILGVALGAPRGAALALVAAVVVIGVGVAIVWPPVAYERWRYVVGADTLELRRGVVVHARSWVPWFRIQHVDVEQGPFERQLGLAHLVLHTASAATDATIPGIRAEEAHDVRALILSRVGRDDGV